MLDRNTQKRAGLQLPARFRVTISTMFAYKDFVPKRLRKQGFIKPPLYETLQDAVSAAGTWVREQEVTVISIETVVLPGVWNKDVPQTSAASFRDLLAPGQVAYTEQFQFVRVWYHSE